MLISTRIGGTPATLKYLMNQGLIDGDCLTVTGKTLAENLKDLPDLPDTQDIIHPVQTPIKSSGHIRILKGDLSPDGSVAKITGKEGLKFVGKAKVSTLLFLRCSKHIIHPRSLIVKKRCCCRWRGAKLLKDRLSSFDMKVLQVVQGCQKCVRIVSSPSIIMRLIVLLFSYTHFCHYGSWTRR